MSIEAVERLNTNEYEMRNVTQMLVKNEIQRQKMEDKNDERQTLSRKDIKGKVEGKKELNTPGMIEKRQILNISVNQTRG